MQPDTPFAACVAVTFITLAAAVTDWRSGRIPNWLTLPPLAAAPLVHGIFLGPGALGASLLGLVACAAVPYLLFVRGAMGGGDVKLLAAIGAVAGIQTGIEIQLLSFLVAATFALGRLAWEGKLIRTLLNAFWLLFNTVLPKRRRRQIQPELMASMRMGGAILAASVAVLLGNHPAFWF